MTRKMITAVTPSPPSRFRYYAESFTIFFFAVIGGLTLSRILFEWLFPRWLWLGRPVGVLPIAALTAFGTWALWQRTHQAPFTIQLPTVSFSPLLLNLLWLLDPTVDLVQSRFIWLASLWLTAVLITHSVAVKKTWKWLGIAFVIIALLPVYLLTMSHTVGAADTFEFQVVTPKLGIVHPTGYPLYLLLGKLFTLLPISSLAWRLNLASVVYALGAMSLFYMLLLRVSQRPLAALLGAVVTGLTVTFWSQAIIAEVYALHALIMMTALFLMSEIGDWRLSDWEHEGFSSAISDPISYLHHITKERLVILLALVIGLGMTNHVTSVFLIPAALLTILFKYPAQTTAYRLPVTDYRFYLKLLAAFLIPLLLYAYLPLRWQAVIGEPMGAARFVDWVIGGRFQGALQLNAWLQDSTRYEIVGRLFTQNWGWFNLLLAAVGALFLLVRKWQTAVVLLLTWLAFSFYALNYYVPDLAVFVIPAQIIIGMGWALGLAAIFEISRQRLAVRSDTHLQSLITPLLLIPTLLLVVSHWASNDHSSANGLTRWGRGVLALPLANEAAILADGEKIAPLNYLQVAEGLRTDLDISVWPDEAAYRAQVDGRLAHGQTVYLARFLPGLQGIYHLRSVGPLTEVSTEPLPTLPPGITPADLTFGTIRLLGYQLEPTAPTDETQTAVTFYWQAQEPVPDVLHVFVRWESHQANDGQHPANNFYPTNAWDAGEIVPDYHSLPRPILTEPDTLILQVALAPPFSNPHDLTWQTVAAVDLAATQTQPQTRPYRLQINETVITAANFPSQTRPQKPLPLIISGQGEHHPLTFHLTNDPPTTTQPPIINPQSPTANHPFWLLTALPTDLDNGRYQLIISQPDSTSLCGWMQPVSAGCVLGDVAISGVPLPENATNYEDKIALLGLNIHKPQLQPGGQLDIDITWQGLTTMNEDYTVFVQVVDANDRIVGQVDSWPVAGTYPTSQWSPGEMIDDQYTLQLQPDMHPGPYRVLVGWYLLGTSRRLPLLTEEGVPLDDKLIVPGLTVP